MISKFYIISAVLCVYIFIHKVKTDDLQFWVRDPKFDYRRVDRIKDSPVLKKATQPKTTNSRETARPEIEVNELAETHLLANTGIASSPIVVSRRGKFYNRQTTPHPKKNRGKNKGRQGEGEGPEKVMSEIEVKQLAEAHLRANTDIASSPTVVSRRGKFYNRQTTPSPKKNRGKNKGRQGEGEDPEQVMSTRIISQTEPAQSLTAHTEKKPTKVYLSPYSIYHQLEQIISKMPEANVSMEILGRTAEYNDIVLLKVTEKKSELDKYFRADDSKYIDEVPEKKIIFIVHALSVMGSDNMFVFNVEHYYSQLFSYYFAHLDKFDIFLIPMANPDGYAYAMNRMEKSFWNKNLSPQNGCAGVALDRNFDVAWNISTPISTCSQHYPGASPFSEPESRAVRDVMHRYSHKIVAYMHLHSGTYDAESFKGDAVLYPKGYTDAQTDDDKYIDLKGEIDESMKNASFKYLSVSVDTLYNWYGKVYGTSVDYASTVYGIPYAMELVMQMYKNKVQYYETVENLQEIALEHVWARVIDVVFKSIWRNMNSNDVQ